jgi:hypothetical protein
VGDSIHALPRRGTPEVTNAMLFSGEAELVYAQFQLYYPGGGTGASGRIQPPVRTLLRFPVSHDALPEAHRAVKYYEDGRPGEADFFHGRGDGTDQEDLSECIACGHTTYKFASHCPQCGSPIQSRRWSRRFGIGLFLCGSFITGVIGTVAWFTMPAILRAGQEVDGNTFSGTRQQALMVLTVYGIVAAFGLTTMIYGIWQVRTGRRNLKVIGFAISLLALLFLIVLLLP